MCVAETFEWLEQQRASRADGRGGVGFDEPDLDDLKGIPWGGPGVDPLKARLN